MKDYNTIETLYFAVGTMEEYELLKGQVLKDDACIIADVEGSACLYVGTSEGFSQMDELTSVIIRKNLFPSFIGDITPEMKLCRTGIADLALAATAQQISEYREHLNN